MHYVYIFVQTKEAVEVATNGGRVKNKLYSDGIITDYSKRSRFYPNN